MSMLELTIEDFRQFTKGKQYKTIYADPPWQFQNRTGKVAPEHKRLTRYGTMKLEEIKQLPVSEAADEKCHLYLWVPNALLPEGLDVMKAWGFEYKTNIIPLIESCSSGPFLELFARGKRDGWDAWGNQATESYEPTWNTYANHTAAKVQ